MGKLRGTNMVDPVPFPGKRPKSKRSVIGIILGVVALIVGGLVAFGCLYVAACMNMPTGC